jgi:hypothetical protein
MYLWYDGPNAISNAIGYAKHFSRSHDAVIRVYDEAGNVIETHEQLRNARVLFPNLMVLLLTRAISKSGEFISSGLPLEMAGVTRCADMAYSAFLALHRYWIHANKMRVYFEKALVNPDWVELARKHKTHPGLAFLVQDPGIFMSYWYGGLYVVIEGWRELALTDPTIDRLLTSPNVDLLKRYRNGAFHFQKNYFDQRFTGFVESQDSVEWVRELNLTFGTFFLREIKGEANT